MDPTTECFPAWQVAVNKKTEKRPGRGDSKSGSCIHQKDAFGAMFPPFGASNAPFILMDLQFSVVLICLNDPEICMMNMDEYGVILYLYYPKRIQKDTVFVFICFARECKRERKAEKNARVEDSVGQELAKGVELRVNHLMETCGTTENSTL